MSNRSNQILKIEITEQIELIEAIELFKIEQINLSG